MSTPMSTPNVCASRKPTKKEWIAALLDGLERTGFTGQIQLTLHYNRGGISRLVPLKEVTIEEQIEHMLRMP